MIKGKRSRLLQWIEGRSPLGAFALRVEVEAVIPDADPSEPCFEPEVIKILDHLQELANEGSIEELEKHGVVYLRRSA